MINKHPLPPERGYKKKFLEEKEVGESWLVDSFREAVKLRSIASFYGMGIRQKKEGNKTRVWRVK